MRGSRLVLPPSVAAPAGTRRAFLKSLAGLGVISLIGPERFALAAFTDGAPGLVFPLVRGPFQNNGATPWYSEMSLGTPPQNLKIALDSGSNFIWVTSTLCAPTDCQHYGGGRFDYKASSTFSWIDPHPKTVDFGPWGTMQVETGQDVIDILPGSPQLTRMSLAESYSGSQFEQLDWDGGIGLPSGRDLDPSVSFFVADLMNAGIIDWQQPYISFCTDPVTHIGTCRIGGVDPSAFDPTTAIIMDWSPYTALAHVQYIWSTLLSGYTVGNLSFVTGPNTRFALDSGSSQFKGDPGLMGSTLQIITSQPGVDVILQVGQTLTGQPGQITVPPSVYNVLIEAGPDAGQVLPQFYPMPPLVDLVLVGSVLMDQFYTVFEYQVDSPPPKVTLSPRRMYLYEKTGGPSGLIARSRKGFVPGEHRARARV
jgi:saccharopepsin